MVSKKVSRIKLENILNEIGKQGEYGNDNCNLFNICELRIYDVLGVRDLVLSKIGKVCIFTGFIF